MLYLKEWDKEENEAQSWKEITEIRAKIETKNK